LGLTGLSAVLAAAVVLLLPDFRRLPFSACRSGLHTQENTLHSSVAAPDPDGSGSFYHQAKTVRKTLIPSFVLTFYF
jgi:hypothetical protein